MRRPVEHGNVVTSVLLGGSSILYALSTKGNPEVVIFWLPIFIGLFEYDVPLKLAIRKRSDVFLLSTISLIALISLLIDLYVILPYILFLAAYALRIPLARRKLNRYGNAVGLLAYSLLFTLTLEIAIPLSLLLAATLFLYLLGSEFAVLAMLKRDRRLLLYNLLPPFLGLLSIPFFIYSLSLVRITVSLFGTDIRKVGLAETFLLPAVSFSLLISLHYGALSPLISWG
ncbi:MAG: hypothetical protein ACP5UO_04020 [Thermoplasmata archaeon]